MRARSRHRGDDVDKKDEADLACRGVSQDDVRQCLQCGVLNSRLSQFGGKPSPVYAFECWIERAADVVDGDAFVAPAAVEAVAEDGGPAEPLPPQPPSRLRQLRVLFAANAAATVVLTAIEL